MKYRKNGVWTSSDRMDRMLFRFMLSTAAYEQPQCGTVPESWQAANSFSSCSTPCSASSSTGERPARGRSAALARSPTDNGGSGAPRSVKYHPHMSDTEYRDTIIATAAATRAEITASDIDERISVLRVVGSGLFAQTSALIDKKKERKKMEGGIDVW